MLLSEGLGSPLLGCLFGLHGLENLYAFGFELQFPVDLGAHNLVLVSHLFLLVDRVLEVVWVVAMHFEVRRPLSHFMMGERGCPIRITFLLSWLSLLHGHFLGSDVELWRALSFRPLVFDVT